VTGWRNLHTIQLGKREYELALIFFASLGQLTVILGRRLFLAARHPTHLSNLRAAPAATLGGLATAGILRRTLRRGKAWKEPSAAQRNHQRAGNQQTCGKNKHSHTTAFEDNPNNLPNKSSLLRRAGRSKADMQM
jgi:hypothetical protein